MELLTNKQIYSIAVLCRNFSDDASMIVVCLDDKEVSEKLRTRLTEIVKKLKEVIK